MRKVLPALFLFIFATSFKLSAQSCFNVAAGNDTTISCTQPCLSLKARIPNIKSTEDYQVISIPYNPYPYVTAAPPFLHPCLTPVTGQDDKYVDTSYIPFNFCFYGLVTNKFVISTNGLITFDLFNALHGSNYTVNQQIPYIGSGDSGTGVCPIPDGNALYPKLSIMGAFHDIYPDINDTANYKIEARVEGTAPCRKFVLSFFNIRLYNCQALRSTFEIVLHEGTGLIDVFVEDKPFCSAAGSNTIIGIQKDGLPATAFTSPPGRNLFTQAITNEGWRFVPNGSTSLLDSVALYKNGAWFAPGTTVDLGNGELEATFNVCQTEDSMSYVVRAFYRQCDNSLLQTEGSDTMIVYKTLNPVTATVTNALCNGGNGTITINSPAPAANIEYSVNGTTWQASPVFTVPSGNYTVQARLVASLCGGSTNVTVTEPAILTSTAVPSFATCPNNDGSIAITAGGGTAPYQYSINNGINYQAGNVFSNLPAGNYNNIRVKDANDCISNASAVIILNDTMRLELGPDSTICFGSSITLLPQTNPQTDTFKWTPATWLNYDTAKNPVASPNDTIKYYLTAKWGVCQRRDSITINILHKPVVDAGKDTTICYKTNALLVGNAFNLSGTVNYAWSPPDSLNTPNAAVTIARIDTTRKFILTVTDNYGCNFSVSDSMWVIMMPPLVVFAGNDTNAIINRAHQLLASGGSNYVWSPVGPLNNPFIANPLAILNADTYFRVVVTDAIGCTDDDTVFIKVYEGPMYYVPNAFTPNGDGTNDIFRPIPVGIQSTEYFRVFNRYGELMYQTNKWMEGWDGTVKGKKAASGTYAWMIKGVDKNGRVVEMKGTVILIQ
jgi:gliding motility-associated-like protein